MHACFAVGTLNSLRDMEGDFGIVPQPKLDEDQKEYYSNGQWSASSYALIKTAADPDMSGDILNVMGRYSVDTVVPAVIENFVLSRCLRDEDSQRMFEIMRDNKCFDLANVMDFGRYTNTTYSIVRKRSNEYVSAFTSIAGAVTKDIDKMLETYRSQS